MKPDEALARWSNPDLYNELVAIAETSDIPTLGVTEHYIRDAARAKSYRDKREALEVALVKRLCDADIFASAIANYASRREVLHPTLWDTLWVDHDLDEIVGKGLVYEKPEFFEASAIPTNLDPIPAWLAEMVGAASSDAFEHDRDYRHIVLHGVSYALSPLHAKIVMLLHQAWLDGEPWLLGKPLLERAGSRQFKMGDVFKSQPEWRDFIDFDGKRSYRLRLEPPDRDSR